MSSQPLPEPALHLPRLPLRMLHDRLLVLPDKDSSERRSSSGIVIPATATSAMGKRLSWATVRAIGPQVRQVSLGDKVLFDPEERAEVDVSGAEYTLLRERDIHAVAEPEQQEKSPGLYL